MATKRRSAAPKRKAGFTIVGVGASAGGVEALARFLECTPKRSGLAFVIIHHRDPSHRGLLAEVLQRATELPVTDARDGETVAPNRVYVIPANAELSIARGKLHLGPPVQPHGQRLPIDAFLRSLASDAGPRAVGVVLSGMGTDGTLGLRAIKEAGGATFVQLPSSAKFDSMPRSAVVAGVADVVGRVEQLPDRILAYATHAYRRLDREHPKEATPGEHALDSVFFVLRSVTGNDFSQYKTSTILRRIERRMGIHPFDSLDAYVAFLRENPHEAELLAKELLIGVTSFFRDPPVWERLAEDVLPTLVRAREGGILRAWVPACSTGEEAYSLAIAIREAVDAAKLARPVHVQIFATDLDRDGIDAARVGIYPANIAADVSPERLERFFVRDERGYRVVKEVREMVVFAPHNVTRDPPFTKVDVLACRNLLIYLAPELQRRLIPLFHYSLNPGGVLLLGTAETVGSFSSWFVPLDGKRRIYGRVERPRGRQPELPTPVREPPEVAAHARSAANSLQSLVERVIVSHHAPAAVLANDRGDVVYVSGRTASYLDAPAGKGNWNVLTMARPSFRDALHQAFSTAVVGNKPVRARAELDGKGKRRVVDLTVERLREPDALAGKILVLFNDAPVSPASDGKKRGARSTRAMMALEQELQRTRDEAAEQMQSSEEELKSTNEELQSTNEELQSTNEELTTSKEELQSLNEELQTVNQELQFKVDELSRANNDMSNLLNSTDVATLFLDRELRLRRYTRQVSNVMKLLPGDTGRPITDMALELDYPELADDAREVLRTLVYREKLVSGRRGQWYAVRILPYRTLEDVIDGVVITFTDASSSKKLEVSLREQTSQLRQLAESLPNLVFGCRGVGTCDYVNTRWVEYTGIPEAEQLGHRWLEQIHEIDREALRAAWARAIESGSMLDVEARIRDAKGAYRWFKVRAVPIVRDDGTIVRWYGSCTDIDDLKRAIEARESK